MARKNTGTGRAGGGKGRRAKKLGLGFLSTLKQAGEAYADDRATLMAAGVAFYAMLSLSPLLLLAVTVAGFAFGETTARTTMEEWIAREVGGQAGQSLVQALDQSGTVGATTLSGLLGIGLLLFGASRFFYALQEGLNHIWNVRPKLAAGLKGAALRVLKKRALSFVLLALAGLLLFATLAAEMALAILQQSLAAVPGSRAFFQALVFVVGAVLLAVAVGLVYMVLPDARVRWRYVWRGAIITSVLLMAGKSVFAWYLARRSLASSSGAAGSIVALVVWVYFSAIVFFFCAELVQAYAKGSGEIIAPEGHATRA